MNNGHNILGVGIDIIENERMEEMIRRRGEKFKDKVFLPKEQKYCDAKASASHHYAARFAVKEAVTKAFGTGIGPHISWLDMEVVRNHATGAPSVKLLGKARELAEARGVREILISLSHTRNYAVAHALVVGNG
ncbi:holo-ACP synthase [Verrucomicrobiota bacterium]